MAKIKSLQKIRVINAVPVKQMIAHETILCALLWYVSVQKKINKSHQNDDDKDDYLEKGPGLWRGEILVSM